MKLSFLEATKLNEKKKLGIESKKSQRQPAYEKQEKFTGKLSHTF